MHKHLESHALAHPDQNISDKKRSELVTQASVEVGPALFYSLLIVAFSFLPVFALEAQEGQLFAPLAYTKTYTLAAAAGLAVTLVPVLMGYFIRGRIPSEASNPINRVLIPAYRPLLEASIRRPVWTIGIAGQVTLEHGTIENMKMPSMTITFTVQDKTLLAGLKEGKKVKFAVENVGGVPTITSLLYHK